MIDIYGFTWEGLQPLNKIKEFFNAYGGEVIAWEPSEAWTKALILSNEGALSWTDAETIARNMAAPVPGAGSSAAVLWLWVIHAGNLEGYMPNLMAAGIGVASAVGGTVVGALLKKKK